MGVQGLWDLLAPVGRRVSVETLAGKRLAIDASIWMVQFMKAMRDEKGEMVRNAHLIGFFRRICKLLFLRTKPVFVFDGGTPSLKRRTLAARRRHRDQARAKLRKTAEKLLLNHLKAKKLEELAAEIKNGRQKAHDPKGKNVILSHDDDNSMLKGQVLEAPGDGIATGEGSSGRTGVGGGEARGSSSIHESLDELLAASLAAEEEGRYWDVGAAAANVPPSKDEGDDDENEEMVFPIGSDNIDPAVLASLPPSMQLDLLVQMRERVMAENRQKYQKLKKAPAKFSVLQIQSYLKTVAFRREIDQVQKHAAGRGLGGIQTSRIASEASREFIFSSSFTGDKETLSRGVAESVCKDHDGAEEATISDKTTFGALSNQPKCDKKGESCELKKDFGPNVETYHDERGLFRVSRVRGLGIRITRDLQRNLDMMKEHEQQKGMKNHCMNMQAPRTDEVTGISEGMGNQNLEASRINEVTGISEGLCQNTSALIEDTDDINTWDNHNSTQRASKVLNTNQSDSIEISFLDDGEIRDTDDNIFLELVSQSPKSNLHSKSAPVHYIHDSDSEIIWEDEVNETLVSPKGLTKQITGRPKCANIEKQSSLFERENSEEDKVEWEEGVCHDSDVTSYRDEPDVTVSRGLEEEEADIQEAIRRSLEDATETLASAETILRQSINNLSPSGSALQDLTITKNTGHHSDKEFERNPLLQPGESDVSKMDFLQRFDSSEKRLDSHVLSPFESGSLMSDEGNAEDALKIQIKSNTSVIENIDVNNCLIQIKPSFSTPNQSIGGISSSRISTSTSDVPGVSFHAASLDGCQESRSGRGLNGSNADISSIVEETTLGSDKMQPQEENVIRDGSSIQNSFDQMEVSEARLDEEILLLRQEYTDLGNEQRKLERNAESVSSEMFAECQELLQMFGLPYIIAPMEAEAQCAYMEIAKLVDGVVTDDSDVFLFGARSVYKNIFDDRKYVETYFMKDIENELGLNHEMLIRMALLLGSDYTEGVSGIGIVNAIEVVHAFPEEDGLQKFREWIESPDLTIFGKFDSNTGSNSGRRSSKESNEEISGNSMEGHTSEGIDVKEHGKKAMVHGDIKEKFKSKHRNISKNWHIPPSFPSESVITAYTSPQVDDSTEAFTWGMPDLLLLRRLCWEKFGWTNKKSDELLGPVLKEYSKHETQLRLEAFYTFNERFAKIRSQRIKKALKGITGTLSSDLTDDVVKEASPLQNKSEAGTSRVVRRNTGNCVSEESVEKILKIAEDVVIDSHIKEQPGQENCGLGKHRSGTERSGGRRGRVGQRGRGRQSSRVRRSGKLEVPSESSSGSSSDSIAGLKQKHKDLPQRSCRKKRVKYAEENFEEPEEATAEQMTIGATAEHQIVEDSCDLDVGAHQYTEDGSKEYLTSGGGFCVDENDPEGEHRIGDDFRNSVLEDGPPRDGLGWGARFGMDEAIEDEHALTDPTPRGEPETNNQLNSDNAQNSEFTSSERANIQTVSQEHTEDRISPVKRSGGTSLRAMPSLRKRRKF